jgi:hypothetical protein
MRRRQPYLLLSSATYATERSGWTRKKVQKYARTRRTRWHDSDTCSTWESSGWSRIEAPQFFSLRSKRSGVSNPYCGRIQISNNSCRCDGSSPSGGKRMNPRLDAIRSSPRTCLNTPSPMIGSMDLNRQSSIHFGILLLLFALQGLAVVGGHGGDRLLPKFGVRPRPIFGRRANVLMVRADPQSC